MCLVIVWGAGYLKGRVTGLCCEGQCLIGELRKGDMNKFIATDLNEEDSLYLDKLKNGFFDDEHIKRQRARCIETFSQCSFYFLDNFKLLSQLMRASERREFCFM